MEAILPFAAAMFVLSQVSERICNFLKLYLPSKWFGNLDIPNKKPDKESVKKEKIRERKILLLSLVSGTITAAMLFYGYLLPTEKDPEPPKWVSFVVKHPLAFPLIALFLSFGAKFWHELLDILFSFKNAQRLIQSGELAFAESTEQINEMLKQSPLFISRRALNDHRKSLMEKPGVTAVAIGSGNEASLRVYFEDVESAAKLNNEFVWTDDFGFPRTIFIEKIVSGPVWAQAAIVGGKIANKATGHSRFGTMGFVFTGKKSTSKFFASSCYHVMRADNHAWDFFWGNGNTDICHDQTCNDTSELVKGFRNDDLDIAIARLGSFEQIDQNSLPPVTASALVVEAEGNPWLHKKVFIKTPRRDEHIVGYIHDAKVEVRIRYKDPNGETSQKFLNFFSIRATESPAISGIEKTSPTVGGDSGSAVYTEDGNAIGLIVGGNDKVSFAMKVPIIEDQLGLSLYVKPLTIINHPL